MNDIAIYLSGIGLTLVCALGVILWLSRRLRIVLVDLCGTAERAHFWTAFSIVLLLLVPLIFVLSVRPDPDAAIPVLFKLSGQLRWGLVGLAGTVLALGFMISRHVPATPPAAPLPGTAP